MIGCLLTRVCKQPIIVLYFGSENELRFYNLEARNRHNQALHLARDTIWESLPQYINAITVTCYSKGRGGTGVRAILVTFPENQRYLANIQC